MKNITNKTKTILFASLIAAMILPFSVMSMADAAPNENASDKAKEVTDERLLALGKLKSQIKSDPPGFEKSTHASANVALKRLSLAEQYVTLEIQGKQNSEKAKGIVNQLLETQKGINLPEIERNPDHQFGQIHKTANYSYDRYTTNSVTRADCQNQGTDFGSARGSITGYSSSAYIVGTLSYPSVISDGSLPNCSNTNWSDHDIRYNLITAPWMGCVQPGFTSSTDTEAGTCGNLKYGDVVLIVVTPQKYGSTNFAFTNPIAVIVM